MSDGLVLIHAFPLDARMWEGQRLGPRTVAPDLPGFGMAPPSGPTMTMAAAGAKCLEAADAAGLDRFVVCGLSMGGYVAFELWRIARDRIAGLVLANTRATADTPEAAQGRRDLATRLRAEGNILAVTPPPLLASSCGSGSGGGSGTSPRRRSPRPPKGWPPASTRLPTCLASMCRRW
jgi:pimeloyl-ACP methyl ester carboxylesterase